MSWGSRGWEGVRGKEGCINSTFTSSQRMCNIYRSLSSFAEIEVALKLQTTCKNVRRILHLMYIAVYIFMRKGKAQNIKGSFSLR